MVRAAALGLLALALAVAPACFDATKRADAHLASADEAIREGRVTDALIELHNALKLSPKDAGISTRIGDLLVLNDDLAEARFYYANAYQHDPKALSAAIKLSNLLFSTDPDEARALVDEILEGAPESAWGQIGKAEQALFDNSAEDALAAAREAVRLEPELAAAHWHLARAHMAQIREAALLDRGVPESTFRGAAEALERYAELDPLQAWRAALEQARVQAAWPGHVEEADAAVREAVELAGARDLVGPEFRALDLALEITRKTGRYELGEWALERRIALDPALFESWEDLASVHEKTERDPSAVYKRMVATTPHLSEAHVRYARMLFREHGVVPAERYLGVQIGLGKAPAAPLLAEVARLHLLSGRKQKAFETVNRLSELYPDSRDAVTMSGWHLLESGRPAQAIALLREVGWADEEPDAQRVIADAEIRRGNAPAARAAIEKLMKMVREPGPRVQRLYARTLHDTGEYRRALHLFQAISRTTLLRPEERLMSARCFYELDGHGLGRKVLEELIDRPRPLPAAVIELVQREGAAPRHRQRLWRAFDLILDDSPNSRVVLTAFARFAIEAGEPERAAERIDASIRESAADIGGLELLAAKVYAAQGDIVRARDTALKVLEAAPETPGALATALALYPDRSDAERAILELTEGKKIQDQSAARNALLGRLYSMTGNRAMARWSYEQALNQGLELPMLKNDLAYLLGDEGKDLERARLLASQAAQALPNDPSVADTLGYILLQSGETEVALAEFQRALGLAETQDGATAEIQYHRGLALAKLGRSLEAERAFEAAISLDADFPDAAKARKELVRLGGKS